MDPHPANKRSAAAREFAAISRVERGLTPSRWMPALPSFALAVAALAACGGKEEAGPELSRHVAVRAEESAKVAPPASGTPWRAGDEPSMAGLQPPAASAASSASATAAIVASATVIPTSAPTPSVPPIRVVGARRPTTPAPLATAPAISPSASPPVVKGKMAPVRAAPLGSTALDDGPQGAVGAAPCPDPKGGATP